MGYQNPTDSGNKLAFLDKNPRRLNDPKVDVEGDNKNSAKKPSPSDAKKITDKKKENSNKSKQRCKKVDPIQLFW